MNAIKKAGTTYAYPMINEMHVGTCLFIGLYSIVAYKLY